MHPGDRKRPRKRPYGRRIPGNPTATLSRAHRALIPDTRSVSWTVTGALRVCCGDKLALLHQNGRLMSNGYEARAHAQHGPVQVAVLVSIPCTTREIPQSATSARHTTTPACSVERGRVALAVTRSEKVGAPGGEGLSQAA